MKVLIACEESQRVCTEFRKLGIEAYSCDIEECSGGHPEWHIQGDVLKILDGNCEFFTKDNLSHSVDEWDLIIAHPPCTYLSCVGNRSFSLKCNPMEKVEQRIKLREEAFIFFMTFVNCKCKHIAVENPMGYCNTHYRKPDQIIQPYHFGDPFTKRTCLWLKNLPALKHTNEIPKPDPVYICQGLKSRGKKYTGVKGYVEHTEGKKPAQKKEVRPFRVLQKQWHNNGANLSIVRH